MIIDTHLHVFRSDDFSRYPFADGSKAADEGAPVELLNETMAEAGVDKAVIVQPIYYRFDNRYTAECLRRFPGKFAAIGLVDRGAPDAPDQLERLVREDKFGGLRIHLARADDPAEWAAPDQDPIWRRAEDLGVCFIVYGPRNPSTRCRTHHRPFPKCPRCAGSHRRRTDGRRSTISASEQRAEPSAIPAGLCEIHSPIP